MRYILQATLLTIFFLLPTSPTFAGAGELDPTFGTGGRVSTTMPGLDTICFGTAMTNDNRIVVVSNLYRDISEDGWKIRITRFLPNGSLDPSFDGDGIIEPTIRMISTSEAACDVAVQSDGKIVITGATGDGLDENLIFVARFSPNGSSDGIAVGEDIGIDFSVTGLTVSASGKILAKHPGLSAGQHVIRRWNSNLTVDTSFGSNGRITVNGEALKDLAVQSDEKILTTIIFNTLPNTVRLLRFNSNGSPDTSFGSGGVVNVTRSTATGAEAVSFGVQSTGKIVVLANFRTSALSFFPHLFRYNSDGTLDTTFGSNGVTSFPTLVLPNTLETFSSLKITRDDKIVKSGVFNSQPVVLRFTSLGFLDTTYNIDGISIPFETASVLSNTDVLTQSDNKIVVIGERNTTTFANRGVILARLLANSTREFDFDGDGTDDYCVFRPSNGTWNIHRSTAGTLLGFNWGLATDKLTPADFDGDGKTDIAVWRENIGSDSTFYIFQSSDNTLRLETFGLQGDIPKFVGDWDGDGKADVAVYRSGTVADPQSFFYYRGSLDNPNRNITFLPWGLQGDRPVRGDFDGDRKMDVAVFRPANATWYIRQSSDNQIRYARWGLPTDKIVSGDFDGDCKTDLAVVRSGAVLEWWILRSSDGGTVYRQFGLPNDLIAAADYNGDGIHDISVWRPGDQRFYSLIADNPSVFPFGAANDKPISAAFTE